MKTKALKTIEKISDFNRATVVELHQKYPQHNWIGPKYELVYCEDCGLSAMTPNSKCEQLKRKAKKS